jgi:hypothetical protein
LVIIFGVSLQCNIAIYTILLIMRYAEKLLERIEQARFAAQCEVLEGQIENSHDMLTSKDFDMLLNKVRTKMWQLRDYENQIAQA